MTARQVARYCPLSADGRALMGRAVDRLGLSARAHDRLLKVARSIADLAGDDEIRPEHLAEAVQYRLLDRER
jgi:magnesium chelatase family protein